MKQIMENNGGSIVDISPESGALSLDAASARLKNMFRSKLLMRQEEAWFTPLYFSLPGNLQKTLSIRLPHELFFRWYSATGRSALEKMARELLGSDITIRYEWPGHSQTYKKNNDPSSKNTSRFSSFDDFISGGRNRESVRLFRRSLSGSPCTILLHGPSGTGKSHLLQAASSELSSTLPGKVIFLSGRELISLFSLSSNMAHTELLSCSAVLADDLQLLEKHPDIQKELAALLDSLTDTFFIASYQTDSNDMSGQRLLPLLYDRLCAHLSLGISEPDLDIRLRYTQSVMESMGLPEHRSTALLLARRCLRLRHIRGMLEQLRLLYEQNGALPSTGEIAAILGRAGSPQPVDTDSILAAVASRYGCTSSQLCQNNKNIKLTLPRQIAMYLCRELLGESYPSLGLIFGGKDHSTVMYSIRKIEKLRVTNKDMHMQLTELTKQCQNSQPRRSE